MRLSLSIPGALLALAGFVGASNVVDLDSKNFDTVSRQAGEGWRLGFLLED